MLQCHDSNDQRRDCLWVVQAAGELTAVLQALQRLSNSRFASAEALVSPPAAGRMFAALSCGDDAVAAETARLLTRLWAPAVSCCL
jgi:DnaJ homolog subfamily C member 13